MVAAPISWFVLISMLLGGGTDLLDYVPTKDYWAAKGVTLSADALVKELDPPKTGADISKLVDLLASANASARDDAAAKIAAMGPGVIPQLQAATKSDDPEVARRSQGIINQIRQSQKAVDIRRLMAIRALGEMKSKEAAGALQKLTTSTEPFVADYASAALAAIDGKPHERAHEASSDDAWMLPEGTRFVMHLSARGGKPVDVESAIKTTVGNLGGARAGAGEGLKPDEMRKQLVEMLVSTAEKTGNIRLDGVTVGVSGDVGPNQGYVTVIVHGKYDSTAVNNLFNTLAAGPMKAESKTVAGVTVFSPSKEAAFGFPSDSVGVLVAGPGNQPVDEAIGNIKAKAGKLKDVPEMAKLLKTAEVDQPIWGVAQMTPAYKQAPFLAPFDTITVVGKPDTGKTRFTIQGTGMDAKQVDDAVAMINKGIAQGKQEMQREANNAPPPMRPMVKMIADVMNSIDCRANGPSATLTGAFEGEALNILSSVMFGIMPMRAETVPAQPQVVPAPVPQRPE